MIFEAKKLVITRQSVTDTLELFGNNTHAALKLIVSSEKLSGIC